MKVIGSAQMVAPREVAWRAFHDPGVLARTIPGVRTLTETGPDAYDLAVVAGVASFKGLYEGAVKLCEQVPHDSFVLDAQGAGAPGTIGARVVVRLSDSASGGTCVDYEADAIVGGAIGGVGQRMLGGVGRKMAGVFFAAIDEDIRTGGTVVHALEATWDAKPEAAATDEAPRVWGGDGRPTTAGAGMPVAASSGRWDLLVGVVAGAAIALAGVAVGRRLR